MNSNRFLGYFYIFFGFVFAIFFAGQLLFQLLGAIFGFMMMFKGFRLLSMQQMFHSYSRMFFDDRFRR